MVDILKNKHRLEAHIEENKGKSVEQLYRENVCEQASDFELSVMGRACALRVIICCIWRRNFVGITAQFSLRRARLRKAIMAICGVSRITLWRALQAANMPTTLATQTNKQQQGQGYDKETNRLAV